MPADAGEKRSVSIWKGGAAFEHETEAGVSYYTDASLEGEINRAPRGPSPMGMVLGAWAGCTGVDLVSILRKMRIQIGSLRIEISAERARAHPRVYTRLHADYRIETDPVDPRRVLRAVKLSAGKYCSISAMLASTAEITYAVHYAGEEHKGVINGPSASEGR